MKNAAWGPDSLGLAVQLISPSLNIVHSIENDDIFVRKYSLDGTVERRSSVLFRSISGACVSGELREVVDCAGYRQRVVGNQMESVFGVFDTLAEVVMELFGASRLARGGQAGDDDELWSQLAESLTLRELEADILACRKNSNNIWRLSKSARRKRVTNGCSRTRRTRSALEGGNSLVGELKLRKIVKRRHSSKVWWGSGPPGERP